jgi:hypothetical protein
MPLEITSDTEVCKFINAPLCRILKRYKTFVKDTFVENGRNKMATA